MRLNSHHDERVIGGVKLDEAAVAVTGANERVDDSGMIGDCLAPALESEARLRNLHCDTLSVAVDDYIRVAALVIVLASDYDNESRADCTHCSHASLSESCNFESLPRLVVCQIEALD